jgi:hypothetical protein
MSYSSYAHHMQIGRFPISRVKIAAMPMGPMSLKCPSAEAEATGWGSRDSGDSVRCCSGCTANLSYLLFMV